MEATGRGDEEEQRVARALPVEEATPSPAWGLGPLTAQGREGQAWTRTVLPLCSSPCHIHFASTASVICPKECCRVDAALSIVEMRKLRRKGWRNMVFHKQLISELGERYQEQCWTRCQRKCGCLLVHLDTCLINNHTSRRSKVIPASNSFRW